MNKKALITSTAFGASLYFTPLCKLDKKWRGVLGTVAIGVISISMVAPAYAQMDEPLIQNYVSSLQTAVNNRHIGQVARLLSDDVVVSITREGKGSTTLDKSSYLDMLQKSWTQTNNYRYSATVDNIVITGDQARAQITSRETWTKDGKPITLVTTSRATFALSGSNAILLRLVSQITVT